MLQSTSGVQVTLDLGIDGTQNEATAVTNFPFKQPVSTRKLDRRGLEDLLSTFEDGWADQHGERLSSAAFYDLYRTGEVDSIFAMAWASYYEAYRRQSKSSADESLVRSLVPG